ncbi:MAG TPA: S8 family serine peptidase, partial [Jatrophihabitantaceae bacterium]|nr:S8 family serine peptidase [Jatrophihabitantaceae bacterium]
MPATPRTSKRALTAFAATVLLAPIVAAANAGAAVGTTATSRHAAAQPAKKAAHARAGRVGQVVNKTHLLSTGKAAGHAAESKLVGFRHHGRQAIFVQLRGEGAAEISRHVLSRASGTAHERRATAQSAVLDRRDVVQASASSVLAAAKRVDGKTQRIFVVSNALPGIGMIADSAALKAIARRTDVVKVSPIVPKTAADAGSEPLIRAVNAWQNTHAFGAGVTVGVIDTGLDYTHADFGGVGHTDPTAFKTAQAKSDSQFYDWHANLPALAKAKIGGGFDFAGDAYDPTDTDPTFDPIPTPNPNPLGCASHGTHVAGIIAGYGENADGSTYTGSYDTLDANDLADMELTPGVAPEATLYPLKVFGCNGGTDLVIPALDAALDPNDDGNTSDHLDIVNMSLGSDYSTPDDPENAVVNQL